MRDFQSKGRMRRFLESRPALAVFLILIGLSVWNLAGFWGKMNETSKNRDLALEKVNLLNESKSKLQSNIGSLETDRGVEEVLREDFGLARQGEGVVVILDDESAKVEPEPERGFWAFWKGLFR